MKTTILILAGVLSGIPALAQGTAAKTANPPSLRAIMESSGIPLAGAKTNVSRAVFYRDQHGRTRFERGSSIIINDPVAGKSYFFDTSNPAQVTVVPLAVPDDKKPAQRDADGFKVVAELGERVFDGSVRARGKRHEVKMAAGSTPHLQKDLTISSEIWFSEDLHLAMYAASSDSVNGGQSVVQFKNVEANVTLEPTFFQPPAGATLIPAKPSMGGVSGVF
jgi:outer membrane lipoprotein-sorting protein